MAYNLQPLITILEGILDPDQPRWVVDENNPQLQSLLHKATSLQQLLDKSSLTKLDSRIREVAHRAEDIIESHMVDHMLSGSNCVRFTFSTSDLQQVTRDLDSLMEQAEKLDFAMQQQLKLVEMEDTKMLSISSSSSKSAVVKDS
ncbi:putative disease resistance protein [Salvia divinorum]|uniref:Disease resistance protein n=1 Tax=Salvia divinorum TaxID=28513 RepID=A0ABD1HKC8_SALDI